MHLLEVAEPAPDLYGSNVSTIVTEEAEAFFKGQKSVEETVSVIQSPVKSGGLLLQQTALYEFPGALFHL